MGYRADANFGRNAMRRVEVVEVDDRDGIQMVTVVGLADEYFEFAYRGQPHGLTSVPKKGAIGYGFSPNGRPDQFFLMGLEHEDDRKNFADREAGESTHYGGENQEVYHDKDGNTLHKAPNGDITMEAGRIVHINPK